MRNDGILPFSNWKKRTEGFTNLIKEEKPDIIGTQEMTNKSKKLLKKLLKKEKLNYKFYGESRKRNKSIYDEYNCILVNENIKVLKNYTYSLSETPTIPKTKFKKDPFPRIITLVETDNYYIYNTHLTHKILKNKMKQLDCISNLLKKDKPLIITGDFNLGNKKLKPFIKKNNLIDTTEKIGNTFSTKKPIFHLDHILTNAKYKNTKKHKYKFKNSFISDHFPITTEIFLNKKWK